MGSQPAAAGEKDRKFTGMVTRRKGQFASLRNLSAKIGGKVGGWREVIGGWWQITTTIPLFFLFFPTFVRSSTALVCGALAVPHPPLPSLACPDLLRHALPFVLCGVLDAVQ